MQELAHLGGLAGDPGQRLYPGRSFRYRRGRVLLKIGFQGRAVGVQLTLRTIVLDLL